MVTRKELNKTIDNVIKQHVDKALEPAYKDSIEQSVISFAKLYVPDYYKKEYSPNKFKEHWINRFLDNVYWGQRHPIIRKDVSRPVHYSSAERAAKLHSLAIMENRESKYRFPNHWELMRYALTATFHEVFEKRVMYEELKKDGKI